MSVVINVTHETGDLSQYDWTVTDGGDLSVTAAAALIGTGGLQCVIDDTTAIYGAKYYGLGTTVFRLRFYINPHSLTMAEGNSFELLFVFSEDPWPAILSVNMDYSSGNYRIVAVAIDDEDAWDKLVVSTISDAKHYVEILLQREVSNGSNDGVLSLWIDGSLKGTVSTVDNYNHWIANPSFWYFGPGRFLDVGTSGTLYLDSLVINNDGSLIGPATTTISLATASLTASGQITDVQPGAVSKALSTAMLTAGGQIADIQPGVMSKALNTAVVTAGGQITDIIPGMLSKLLATAALTASGQTTVITAGAVTKSLATAALAAQGQSVDVQPGVMSIVLDTAAITTEGQIVDVTPGDVIITLDTASLTALGIAVSIVTLVIAFGNYVNVLFRDKRAYVTFRDKRAPVVFREKRS